MIFWVLKKTNKKKKKVFKTQKSKEMNCIIITFISLKII